MMRHLLSRQLHIAGQGHHGAAKALRQHGIRLELTGEQHALHGLLVFVPGLGGGEGLGAAGGLV